MPQLKKGNFEIITIVKNSVVGENKSVLYIWAPTKDDSDVGGIMRLSAYVHYNDKLKLRMFCNQI